LTKDSGGVFKAQPFFIVLFPNNSKLAFEKHVSSIIYYTNKYVNRNSRI